MLPFEDFSSILLTGLSQSGKSTFIHKLCQHADVMFTTPVDYIIYVYKHHQPSFQELQKQLKEKIMFTDKTPNPAELEEMLSGCQHTLMILDDAFNMLFEGDEICQALVTRLGHHLKISTVFATQSAQVKNKGAQSILKGIHNIVVMSSPREVQYVKNIGVQLGEYQLLKEAFSHICKEPYRYLVIGLHPKRDRDLKFTSHIFPGEVTRVYLNKNHKQ